MLRKHAMRPFLRAVAISLVAGGFAAGVATCKQDEGDRCQVDTDCAQGLVCNRVTSTCQTSAGGGPDGSIRPDAAGPAIDARPVDARPPDARVDASIDAPPT